MLLSEQHFVKKLKKYHAAAGATGVWVRHRTGIDRTA